MVVYVCVELESITEVADVIEHMLQRCKNVVVTKDRHGLCTRCNANEHSIHVPASIYPELMISPSTPLSLSECADSEGSDNAMNEMLPVNEDTDEFNLLASGSELLQQVSATFSSYQENTSAKATNSESSSNKGKSVGSATKQCQLCERWITTKNVRAHVATHLTIRRLRCTTCGQGFDRMNRASIHITKSHPGHPMAKIEPAMLVMLLICA